MVGRLSHYGIDWLTGGIHLIILVVAAEARSPAAWPYALGAMALVSLFAWGGNFRRYRLIHDLPTSKVASAAQGYVELFGSSLPIADAPLKAPLSGMACCWYRYRVEHRRGNKWAHHDSGSSSARFLLDDGTGQCVISPGSAEVLYARRSQWTRGNARYTEWLLLPHGDLYAVGDFRTRGGANAELDENRDVRELLSEWKQDTQQLLARYDSDGDGQLDLEEWERARLDAQHRVRNAHANIRSAPGVHVLAKPADGRLFLLAGALPERIGRRFELWSWVHLTIFFAAGGAAMVLIV